MPKNSETTKVKKSKADKRMTNRQTLLVRGMAEGKTITQAAIDAGYSPKNPDRSGWQALKTIRQGFVEAADALAITPRAFIEKYVVPGMSASYVPRGSYMGSFFSARELDPDDPEGKRMRDVTDPDWQARLRFQTLFARLMGAMREEEKVTVSVEHTHAIDLRKVPREALIAVVKLAAIGADRRLPSGGGTVQDRTIDLDAGD